MVPERRRENRVKTHIVSKIINLELDYYHYVYIENMSTTGIGIVSIEPLQEGMTLRADFFLPGTTQRITPKATVVHSSNRDALFYSGLAFDSINDEQLESLRSFIKSA